MPFRIIFMGTPEFSVPVLQATIKAGHTVSGVYCQAPRPAGRGMKDKKSPVHQIAEQMNIPVFCPKSLKSESVRKHFLSLNADIAVVVAYGLILPEDILNIPLLGCFNGHASLLPRWRGAAPIQRAIEAGDKESGITIMRMTPGLDTGPILMQKKIAITDDMTFGVLHDRLSCLTADSMIQALSIIEHGNIRLTPQTEEKATYANKITKFESRINWNKPAIDVRNHIHALSPFPGAWCEINIGKTPLRLKILQSIILKKEGIPGTILDKSLTIACAQGSIRPIFMQKAGKCPGTPQQFLCGHPVSVGTVIA